MTQKNTWDSGYSCPLTIMQLLMSMNNIAVNLEIIDGVIRKTTWVVHSTPIDGISTVKHPILYDLFFKRVVHN